MPALRRVGVWYYLVVWVRGVVRCLLVIFGVALLVGCWYYMVAGVRVVIYGIGIEW